MNALATPRHTADERREEIIRAAVRHFGETGLHGTSTEAIARDVGVSQPYLFRLFGTKKELFMAALRWAFDHTVDRFREAGEAAVDQHDAFRRIGFAYEKLVSDRRYLEIQLQAYASTSDPEIRRLVNDGFGRMVMEIERHTQATPQQLAVFVGRGMLMNVTSSIGALDDPEGWASMIREGCMEEIRFD
jgi:AcrR family transcriptional regulator